MFTYEKIVSAPNFGSRTEVVDTGGTWGDFKQSHADLALNSGEVFLDTAHDKFEIKDSYGQTNVFRFVLGDFEKAEAKEDG